jgi:hypothetical protein
MKKQVSFFTMLMSILSLVIIMGTSCKKDLYEGPITAPYGSNFWTSQSAVEQASLAMYGQLRGALTSSGSYFINGDLVSGTFVPKSGQWNYQYYKASNNPPFNFATNYYLEDLQDWSRFYRIIAQANLILQNVPKMDASLFKSEATRNSYISEALFIRAYTYFYMIRIWGDPVYVNKTFDDVDYGKIPPIARTAENVVLDSCINDLKVALGSLVYAGGDPTQSIRANKGTVSALMAHIYAWKHDYSNAHIACQDVIKNGGYTMEPIVTYTNIWKGQTSNESIFELPMKFSANDRNFSGQYANNPNGDYRSWAEAQFDFFGQFLKGPIVDNRNNQCWLSPDNGMVDWFYDHADARYKTIWTHMPASNGDVAGYMLLKYANFTYQKPNSIDPSKSTQPFINNNLVLLRLSDIILLDAESLASINDLEGARKAVKLTEDRAGVKTYLGPSNTYDMLNEIVKERGRELFGEGQWYYDLIRTQQAQSWLAAVGYPTDGRTNPVNKGYYWPLDMAKLFPYDNLLTQNPWWTTHK